LSSRSLLYATRGTEPTARQTSEPHSQSSAASVAPGSRCCVIATTRTFTSAATAERAFVSEADDSSSSMYETICLLAPDLNSAAVSSVSPSTPDGEAAQAFPSLRQRVSAAILDAAADLIAARGADASMSDIAAAAGVARATLYRYFPTRAALLTELHDVVVAEVGRRLELLRLDEVDTEIAVERAVRALVEAGEILAFVAGEDATKPSNLLEVRVKAPLQVVFERGQRRGEVRPDVTPRFLVDALFGVVSGVLRHSRALGREEIVSKAARVFTDGVRGNIKGGPKGT
jgi:TetR/AcrR family transcriptional regulator, mexCD-oprJ operon repressor